MFVPVVFVHFACGVDNLIDGTDNINVLLAAYEHLAAGLVKSGILGGRVYEFQDLFSVMP